MSGRLICRRLSYSRLIFSTTRPFARQRAESRIAVCVRLPPMTASAPAGSDPVNHFIRKSRA